MGCTCVINSDCIYKSKIYTQIHEYMKCNGDIQAKNAKISPPLVYTLLFLCFPTNMHGILHPDTPQQTAGSTLLGRVQPAVHCVSQLFPHI